MALIEWIVQTLEEMEIYLFQSMKRNLKRHQAWEEDEGFRWTQWQALQMQSLNKTKNQYKSLINETFQRLNPEAEKLISEAFHEGAARFDEQYAEAKQYENAGKKWAELPVPEARNQLEVQAKETISIEVDLFSDSRPSSTIQGSTPKPPVRYAPRLKYEPPKAEVTSTVTLAPPSDETFFKVNKPKLDAVLNDVQRDMNIARYSAAQRAGVIYEDIIKKADVFFQTGTMTIDQAIDKATRELANAGLNCIEYSNGRRVNVASYVEMVLRTSSRRSSLTAEGAKRTAMGTYLVTSPTLHSTCPSCGYWQGRILIDDVYADGEADHEHQLLSYAVKYAFDETGTIPSHFLGVNCRHPLVTYFEGVTQIPTASPFDKTRTQYNAEQQQRYLERMIRQWKRRAAIAMAGDERKKANAKVKEWTNRLNLHVIEHRHLRRQPRRERLYPPDQVAS